MKLPGVPGNPGRRSGIIPLGEWLNAHPMPTGQKLSGLITKPGGGTMKYCSPLNMLSESEYDMFRKKIALLDEARKLNMLPPEARREDLAEPLAKLSKDLFPLIEGQLYVLSGEDGTFRIVSHRGLGFDPNKLDLGPMGIIRRCGEVSSEFRRTVFLMNTAIPDVFLADKSNTYVFGDKQYYEGLHTLEEGTIAQSGFKIDAASFANLGIQGIVMAPILRFGFLMGSPYGTLVFIGKRGFLNPFVDLMVISELSDYLATSISGHNPA